jgi:hypothetical protein
VTVGGIAGSISFAGAAGADQPGSVPEAPLAPKVLVAGSVAVAAGLNLFGVSTRFEGGYRAYDGLLLGAYFEIPITADRSDGDNCADAGVECVNRYFLGGARVMIEPYPTGVFTPWFAGSAGVVALEGANAKPLLPAFGLDLGFEFRIVRAFGVGPYLSTTFVTADPYVYDPGDYGGSGFHSELWSLGLRFAGRLDAGSD